MAFNLPGKQAIATQFKADAQEMYLIGVKANIENGFVGVFDTRTELQATYPGGSQALGKVAFVKDYNGGGPSFAEVKANISTSSWQAIGVAETLSIDLLDLNIGLSEPIAFDFESDTEQKDINLSSVALAWTDPTVQNQALTLSGDYYFQIDPDEANNELIVVQGIVFKKDLGAGLGKQDIYVWGFGVNKWAFFTENGEFTVTDFALTV